MPASRLRLRFAAWFALAFALGIGGLEVGIYLALRRDASRRLSRDLVAEAETLSRFLAGEAEEAPRGDFATVMGDGLKEFLPAGDVAAVYDSAGVRIAEHGDPGGRRLLPATLRAGAQATARDLPSGEEHPVRVVTIRYAGPQSGAVAVLAPTEPMYEELENLLRWLLLTAPLVAGLSAGGGYLLSRRAVRPMRDLARSIGELPAADRAARLPTTGTGDEVDHLAVQFNALLDRLREAESRNQQFVREAAHQIRTPLTIVLGETDLSLAPDADPADAGTTLRRVQVAATQMKRRVDELFLLAESESDTRVVLRDDVDLEGLAFEVTDLMRGRAAKTGHRLELERVDAVTVVGSEPLLREALVELLENACRHSTPGSGVAVSAYVAGECRIEVRSAGAAFGLEGVSKPTRGVGLRILGWIARRHGGRVTVTRSGDSNLVAVAWPSLGPPGQGERVTG
jgi:signal transduction histidine kinase